MARLGSELQLALVGVCDSLFIAACWAVFCCCYFLSFCFGCCLHTRLSFLCLLLLLLALRLVCVINVQTSPARCTRNCGEKLKEKLSSCCVHIACKVIPTTLQKNKASSQHIVRSVGKARVGRKRLLPAHEAILAQRLVPNLHRLCGAVKKKKLNVTGLVAWSGGNVTCGGNSKHFSSTFVGGERRRVCCSFYSWLMVRENEKRPWHLFLLSFCVCVFLFSWDRSRCSFFIFCCSNLFFFLYMRRLQ